MDGYTLSLYLNAAEATLAWVGVAACIAVVGGCILGVLISCMCD